MDTELDDILKKSLTQFVNGIIEHGWYGKEREAISLYAFGTLLNFCKPGTILDAPAQIGIEVRVPKPNRRDSMSSCPNPKRSQRPKNEVMKDLVIWQKPGLTCWDNERKPRNYPLAVIEWKVNDFKLWCNDIDWLTDFTSDCETVGYAVALDLNPLDLNALYRGSPDVNAPGPIALDPTAPALHLCCDRFAKGIRETQWHRV